MSKKDTTVENEELTDSTQTKEPSTPEETLFEIRDLLFGEQQQAIQNRITSLERNLQHKLQEINDLFSSALNNLRQESQEKISHLTKHVEELNKKHSLAEEGLSNDIDDLQDCLDSAKSELRNADNELDAHLNKEANRLMLELTNKYNEMMSNLKATSDELKNNKADRKTLATLLASVADNLNENE